ncbi:MAG: His/Gly/Thr/Pro-type tRNA ligase C-terminal domain-containing protein, partial [Candidatus Parvarchaeum sp.]
VVLAGGGRYDRISRNFGSDFAIVGGSIGFDVVMEVLTANYKNEFYKSFCVINVDDMYKAKEIAVNLRENGITTDILLDSVSLSKGLDYCNSKKIKYAIIVGKRDLKDKLVTVRDLETKREMKFNVDSIIKEIKNMV